MIYQINRILQLKKKVGKEWNFCYQNSLFAFILKHILLILETPYFFFKSFENLIKQTGLKILDYQTNSINGGSISFNLALKISDVS